MYIIKNGKVLTMANVEYDDGYVVVDGNKIVEVGQGGNDISGADVIDAQGGYILPGFIDAHCHIGMWEDSVGEEGADGNEGTDPVTPQLKALDGVYNYDKAFREAYEAGVTSVVTGPGSANVIGGQFIALKTYGKVLDDMIIKDPVAVKIAFGENPKSVYGERKEMPTTRMAVAALVREYMEKAKEYVAKKKKHRDNAEENDMPEYDPKLEALELVLEKKIPFKAHAHRADDIATAIRLAKEFDVDITLDHCTEGHLITDTLLKHKLPVILGPILCDRSKIELRNSSVKAPKIVSDAGVDVAIMTDHPVIPIQYLSLSAAIAAREGMDKKKALEAITINAARSTGIEDRVGSLEKGKDADLVIFDNHPFLLESKVQYTIINGEIIYDNK